MQLLKKSQTCFSFLSLFPLVINLVKLLNFNFTAQAMDPSSEDFFIVRGNTQFTKGIHCYEVILESVQRDCAGYGIGICNIKDYEKFLKEFQTDPDYDVTKMLLGITANNSGMSKRLKGKKALLKNGFTLKITVDRDSQKLTILGPGIDLQAKLKSEVIYIPVFTRCHGKFKVTVKPLTSFHQIYLVQWKLIL